MLKVIRKKILLGGIDPTNAIYIYTYGYIHDCIRTATL